MLQEHKMLITCKNVTVVHLLCFWHDKYSHESIDVLNSMYNGFLSEFVSTSKLPIMNSSTYSKSSSSSNNNNSKEDKRWTPFHGQTRPVEIKFCRYIWRSWRLKCKHLMILKQEAQAIVGNCFVSIFVFLSRWKELHAVLLHNGGVVIDFEQGCISMEN